MGRPPRLAVAAVAAALSATAAAAASASPSPPPFAPPLAGGYNCTVWDFRDGTLGPLTAWPPVQVSVVSASWDNPYPIPIYPPGNLSFMARLEALDAGVYTTLTLPAVSTSFGAYVTVQLLFDSADAPPNEDDAAAVDVVAPLAPGGGDPVEEVVFWSMNVSALPPFGASPWLPVAYAVGSTASHSVQFRVRNVNDDFGASALFVANVSVCVPRVASTTTTPSATATLTRGVSPSTTATGSATVSASVSATPSPTASVSPSGSPTAPLSLALSVGLRGANATVSAAMVAALAEGLSAVMGGLVPPGGIYLVGVQAQVAAQVAVTEGVGTTRRPGRRRAAALTTMSTGGWGGAAADAAANVTCDSPAYATRANASTTLALVAVLPPGLTLANATAAADAVNALAGNATATTRALCAAVALWFGCTSDAGAVCDFDAGGGTGIPDDPFLPGASGDATTADLNATVVTIAPPSGGGGGTIIDFFSGAAGVAVAAVLGAVVLCVAAALIAHAVRRRRRRRRAAEAEAAKRREAAAAAAAEHARREREEAAAAAPAPGMPARSGPLRVKVATPTAAASAGAATPPATALPPHVASRWPASMLLQPQQRPGVGSGGGSSGATTPVRGAAAAASGYGTGTPTPTAASGAAAAGAGDTATYSPIAAATSAAAAAAAAASPLAAPPSPLAVRPPPPPPPPPLPAVPPATGAAP